MQLREVGMHIHRKRKEIGISQAQLAKLARLSRTTLGRLERGVLEDLSYAKLNHLMAIVGLNFEAKETLKKSSALKIAAQTASTSYKKILTPDVLKGILNSGALPDDFKPHMLTLLDEVSVQLVFSAIHEAALETNMPAKMVMKHVAAIAKSLHAYRTIW